MKKWQVKVKDQFNANLKKSNEFKTIVYSFAEPEQKEISKLSHADDATGNQNPKNSIPGLPKTFRNFHLMLFQSWPRQSSNVKDRALKILRSPSLPFWWGQVTEQKARSSLNKEESLACGVISYSTIIWVVFKNKIKEKKPERWNI